MLVLASQQLQLAGNVRGALAALQAADQRLRQAEKLAATPLRRAITQDMDRLKAVPQLDTVGIAVKLDGLIAQAETLPLVIAETPPRRAARSAHADGDSGLSRAARDFWEEMKGLVRIRDLETPTCRCSARRRATSCARTSSCACSPRAWRSLARDEPRSARTCAPPGLDREVLRRQGAAHGRARHAEAGGRQPGARSRCPTSTRASPRCAPRARARES
jgi:hypothetical protein